MQKPWHRIALATALVAALGAAPAFAGGPTKAGDTKAISPAASPSMSGGGDFVARHTMTGEVTRVDQKNGRLTLKTAEGNLDLHFPPSALSSVKKGDRVSVELAMKPEGAPSASGAGDKSGPASTTNSNKKY